MANKPGSSRRTCINSPDSFCYICGSYTIKNQRRNITSFVKNAYYSYFKVKLGDQDRSWAPHIVCKTCLERLRYWQQGKRSAMPFGIPMVWREPKNHYDDCYFCLCSVVGYNRKNKTGINYPNLPSAIRPVPHGPDTPIPIPPVVLENVESSVSSTSSDAAANEDVDFLPDDKDNGPQLFHQSELNDLIRDLGLSKENSEILGSRLKEKNLLAPGTTFYWYRNREKEFQPFFTKEDQLVYCVSITDVIRQLGEEVYNPSDWRLFIDSSKRSLKSVLLHNGNKYASVPIAHSVYLKETYENLRTVLEKINYNEHKWVICGDLKVSGMLLGQQGGFTKFPCFLCEWDSRARDKHWTTKEWPSRKDLTPGAKNIVHISLVDPQKILLPPLHIKLGIMKQFVKALSKSGGPCFQYLFSKFPALSDAKIKEGIFDGPQIRKLMKDTEFSDTMNVAELQAWNSFKEVATKFLGNFRDPTYETIVENMLEKLRILGCNMSIKLHFLFSHLDYFPENLGDYSEEQGERFHQDIKEMERRYQGRWDVNMLADYCWSLKRETLQDQHKRKSTTRTFETKRKRVNPQPDPAV